LIQYQHTRIHVVKIKPIFGFINSEYLVTCGC
jgi:hypothetical protein